MNYSKNIEAEIQSRLLRESSYRSEDRSVENCSDAIRQNQRQEILELKKRLEEAEAEIEVKKLKEELSTCRELSDYRLQGESSYRAEVDRLKSILLQTEKRLKEDDAVIGRLEEALKSIAKSYIEGELFTCENSMGNYDDVFNDGVSVGEHYQAEIAKEALTTLNHYREGRG